MPRTSPFNFAVRARPERAQFELIVLAGTESAAARRKITQRRRFGFAALLRGVNLDLAFPLS